MRAFCEQAVNNWAVSTGKRCILQACGDAPTPRTLFGFRRHDFEGRQLRLGKLLGARERVRRAFVQEYH